MPTLDVESCLSDNQINYLIDGHGKSDDLASIERHLADCVECRAVIGARAASLVPVTEEEPITTSGLELGAERYEVRREIARGGMGRILEAWDRRHDRRVALKVRLRSSVEIEARFAREVLLTARLQHPSIAALYDTGSLRSGEPFFVMKLIEGRSLAEVARDAETLPQRLALLPHLVAITEALAYAHDQRIIHRDLKPANVLIGTFGETVVIDWGLAKDLRAPEEPPEPAVELDMPEIVTIQGHALGTPHYMSPEQARGEAVDERGDVYALGSLLYHVLAGAPPYASSARTSRAILAALVAGPPDPLPQQAPGVPADLVAIVDKAMARDPAGRYASAREMATDLERFAQGRLVGAHTYSRSTLLRRWLSRHKALLAMVAILVTGIGITAGLSIRRIERERDRADVERRAAEEGNRTARAHSEAAEALVEYAVGDLRDQVAALGRVDVMAGVGKEVEKYYDALASLDGARGASAPALVRRAVGLGVLGDVASARHDLPDARALATRAIGLVGHALAIAPADSHTRETLVKAELRLADVDIDLGRLEEGRSLTRTAADSARTLVREQPNNKSARLLAVEAARDLRERLAGGPDPTAALDSARAVPDLLRTLSASDPGDLDLQLKLGDAEIELGIAQGFFGRDAEMLGSEQDALAVLARVAERTVDDTRVQAQQATALQLASGASMSLGDANAALAFATRSLALREQLVKRDPSNADWQHRLALANAAIADSLRALGRTKEALAFSERQVQLTEMLARTSPTSVSARGHVARALLSLAETQRANNARQAALESLAKAQAILKPLATADELVWRWLLAEAERAAGQIELDAGMLERARTDAASADELARGLAPDSDDSVLILKARTRGLLGQVERGDGRALLAEARAMFDQFWIRDHDRTEWFRGGPETARALASLLVRQGERAAARQCLEETCARVAELAAKGRIPPPQRELVTQLREQLARIAR